MQITFLGATKTVTGSKFLIQSKGKKVLVDCGLFQGYKELRQRNWEGLPVDPRSIDAVILTHAHIDHSGYIPLLVKQGFKGKIYCSEATYNLCTLLLPDSGYLQEEDARRANKYGYTKHKPARPLYTGEDAQQALEHFRTLDFGVPCQLDGALRFTLSRAGHILGAAFISLSNGEKTVVFSGDLGRTNDPIMKPPAKLQHADYLLIESTYGDRLHKGIDPAEELKEIVNSTSAKGGSVIIPAFAVGRTQTVLYYIHQLRQSGKISEIPVFLDSPMAISATELFFKFRNDHQLSEKVCREIDEFVTYTRTPEESKRLEHLSMPSIIISASGMATGGRVLHHLKHFVTSHNNTILFAGFQAGGTRGDRMVKGETEVKIHGDMYPVKARVENLSNISAHADYEEILQWLGNFQKAPKKVFITHGSPEAAASLQAKIKTRFGWHVEVPEYLHAETLS